MVNGVCVGVWVYVYVRTSVCACAHVCMYVFLKGNLHFQ